MCVSVFVQGFVAFVFVFTNINTNTREKENENKNCWPVCVSVFVQGCVAGGQNGRGGGSSLKFVPTPIHDVFHVYLLACLDVGCRSCIASRFCLLYTDAYQRVFYDMYCLNAFLCFFPSP